MNVIAADMCTNARRVRKRWLPKIQSLLPTAATPRSKNRRGGANAGGGASARESGSPFDVDLRSYLLPDLLKEKEAGLVPHLQFVSSRGGVVEEERAGLMGAAMAAEAEHSSEQHESSSPSSDAFSPSSHSSPQPPDQD